VQGLRSVSGTAAARHGQNGAQQAQRQLGGCAFVWRA